MQNDVAKILVTEEEIAQRCRELGEEITQDYQGKQAPILVSILKGAAPFLTEIAKRIDLPVEIEFMCVSSYEGTGTTGNVKIIMDLSRDVKGQNILIVEDIVDSGRTLSYLKEMMLDRKPESLRICTLLDKPDRRVVDVNVDYTGFHIPDEFVVGYGLDYDQRYRNLPYIGILKPEVYS